MGYPVVGPISRRQAETVLSWIRALGRRDLKILDAGCGAGWLVQEIVSVEPVGDGGALRIWNAPKVERVADALFGVGRYERFKERRFLGHTLMARARLR